MDIFVRLTMLRVNYWENTLNDSIISSSPHQIRTLFAIIISTCFPSNLKVLRGKYRDDISGDVLRRVPCQTLDHTLQMTAEIYIETLIIIEDIYLLMANKVLSCLSTAAIDRPIRDTFKYELQR